MISRIRQGAIAFTLASFSLVSCASTPENPSTSTNPGNSSETQTQIAAEATTETPSQTEPEAPVTLTPITKAWQDQTHIHSIALDDQNPDQLYIATHHGIIKYSHPGEWFQVGKNRSDFMSFVTDPQDSQRFYGSGHPPTGGNLGFMVSENKGQDWKLKSLPGVDFHAMAIAPNDPNLIYGWITSGEQGEYGFYRSSDRGKTWEKPPASGLNHSPFGLTVDPLESDRLLATTPQGLYKSEDGGQTWEILPDTQQQPIAALGAIEENNQSVLYGFTVLSQNSGQFFRSTDGGETWEPVGQEIPDLFLYLAISDRNPQIFYAANDRNQIWRSADRGQTWELLNE